MIDTDQPVRVSKIEVIENVPDRASDAEAKVKETEHKSTEVQDKGADETLATSSISKTDPATTPASTAATTTSAITSPTPTKSIETETSKSDAGKEQESEKEKSEEKENDKNEKGREKEKDKDKAKESTESSIVTPDYIQQSMFRLFDKNSHQNVPNFLMPNRFSPFSNSKCSSSRQFESRDRRETVELAAMP